MKDREKLLDILKAIDAIEDYKVSSYDEFITDSKTQDAILYNLIIIGEAANQVSSSFKDDFAWENDKIAFRMYGPALEADGEVSSGIDVWSKSTPRLVINDWYQKHHCSWL